nr:TonB-dependent receptor [Parvularcula dongshanensis]
MPPLAFALLATPTLAQEADTIVVTATKTAAAIEDIPASVDVLTLGEEPGRLRGAEDVASLLSGVQVAVANGSQPVFQIRGIGAVDHQALTPGAAAVYRDGVFLATNVQTGFLLYDLARAEVLKEPQGTLYGRNASSGAIDFVSVRPGPDQPGSLRVGAGNKGYADVEAAGGTQLAEGVYGRLAGRVLRQGPFLDNVAGPREAGGVREAFGLRGSVLREGGVEVLLSGHYEHEGGVNASPRNDTLDLADHEIAVGADGVRDTDNDFWGGRLELSGEAGGWDLFSLTAYEAYSQDYGFDFDGTPAPYGDPNLNANLSYDRNFFQWSEELRGSRTFGRLSTMIGLHGSADDFAQDYLIWCGALDRAAQTGTCPYVGAPGRVGPTPASDSQVLSLLTRINQDRRTAAVFTSNDVMVTDTLTLTLGGRWTYERIEGEGFGIHLFADGTRAYNDRDGLGAAVGSNVIEDDRLTGNGALRWRVAPSQTVYLSYATGYKSGGFNGEVANNAGHYQDEGLFGAETVGALELGYKGRVGVARIEGALFHQDYDDPQARIFVDFPQPDGGVIVSNSLSNLDAAEVWGAEASAALRLFEGFEVEGSVTLLDTEIQQGAGANEAFGGNSLPFASDVTAVLAASYERPLAEGFGLFARADAKHSSGFYLDAEGLTERRQEAYTMLNAEVGLTLPRGARVSLWSRNLTNEDVAVSGYGFIGYDTFRSPPRTWGLSAELSF